MKCPQCKKTVDKLLKECPFCGAKLRTIENGGDENGTSVFKKRSEKRSKDKSAEKRSFGLFGVNKNLRSDKPINVKFSTDGEEVKSGVGRLKVVIAVGIAAVAVLLAAVLVMTLTASKGARLAEDASLYIGRSVQELQEGTGEHFIEESTCYGVNSAVEFDHIYESEKQITAQGIKYPSWVVRVKLSEIGGHIAQVSYIDFSVIKGDPRGKKRSSQIDLDRFASGAKLGTVLKDIDIAPYAVTYNEDGSTMYTYRYYYERDNGDEQAAVVRVVFNKKNKYKYSTAEIVMPDVDS